MYPLIACFVYVKMDKRTQRRILELFCKNTTNIEPESLGRSARIAALSAVQQQHFEMLAQQWK